MAETIKRESFRRKFIRQAVRADFKSNDSILPSAFSVFKLISPADYIKGSRLARFGEVVWSVMAFLLFSICFLAIAVGWPAVYDGVMKAEGWRSFLSGIGVGSLFLYSLYVSLALFGYLRWMSKKRRK